MTIQMTATEVKAKILALLDDVAAGQEIEITRHGRTIARLVPAGSSKGMRGSQTGVAMTNVDDENGLYSAGIEWDLG